jgi:hypothetical protein
VAAFVGFAVASCAIFVILGIIAPLRFTTESDFIPVETPAISTINVTTRRLKGRTLRVAMFGDQGLGRDSEAVLRVVRDFDAHFILHAVRFRLRWI